MSTTELKVVTRTGAWVFVIACTLLGGCREEALIQTPQQVQVARDYWVRVLLANNIKSCTLKVPSAYTLSDAVTSGQLARSPGGQGQLYISTGPGMIVINQAVYSSREIKLVPDQPFVFYVDNRGYRGELRILQNTDGTFDLVNYVPLETYLAGVVGAEMPSYWEPEALKAQAITSRTYCLYIKEKYGSRRSWDVNKTQANQVYLGIDAESPKVWDAVRQTTGQVLNCRSQTGTRDIFPAYFSSVCGGRTECSKKVFGDEFESLQSVSCPYCRKIASRDMFFWPVVQFDKAFVNTQLSAKYPNLARLGQITKILPVERSQSEGFSRVTMFKLVGSNGQSDMIRAEDLRLSVDPAGRKLRSTICNVTELGTGWSFFAGRGFGHGVGFCQYGAQGMARESAAAPHILSYYYPGSTIQKLY